MANELCDQLPSLFDTEWLRHTPRDDLEVTDPQHWRSAVLAITLSQRVVEKISRTLLLFEYVANLRRMFELLMPQRSSVHTRSIAVPEAIERALLLADLFGDFVKDNLWHSGGVDDDVGGGMDVWGVCRRPFFCMRSDLACTLPVNENSSCDLVLVNDSGSRSSL